MENIIGLKELRQNIGSYIAEIKKGKSFIIIRRSMPVFKISPPEELEVWEPIVDFTKIKKGGIPLKNLLARL